VRTCGKFTPDEPHGKSNWQKAMPQLGASCREDDQEFAELVNDSPAIGRTDDHCEQNLAIS
jgi:hypothetical protein